MTMIRVVIADRDFGLRSELCLLLAKTDDIEVIGEAADALHAVRAIERWQPDVLLLDERLPPLGALAVLDLMASVSRSMRTVILHDRPCEIGFALQLLARGIRGCMSRSNPQPITDKVIRTIQADEYWLERSMMAHALQRLLERGAGVVPEEVASSAALTEREREIIDGVGRGLTNKEIARQLGISDMTVKSHLQNIYAKLGVHRRTQLLGRGKRY